MNDYNGRWSENRQLIMLLERSKERAWRSMDEFDAACERERTRLRTVRSHGATIGERKSLAAEMAGFYSRLQPALLSIILIATVYAFMTSLRTTTPTHYIVHVPVVAITATTNVAATTTTDYTLILFAAAVFAAAVAWHQRKRLCLNVCARRLGQRLIRRLRRSVA